ncbi:MAG: hypothetical protein MJ182_01030 [Treponema sp.]|nr:hypothetical protein [Treponema sp.]
MGKKNLGTMKLIELIGFVLAAVGFCLPLTKGKVFGSNGGSGLNFIKNLFDSSKGNTFLEVMALLVFVFAVCGVLVIILKDVKIYGLACAVGGIACGVLFYLKSIGVFDSGVSKGFAKAASKVGGSLNQPYVGIYLLVIGFVVALVGAVLRKK